jgi:3-phosphoshikimate 1-carboxyvinyltransferase
MDLTIYPAAPLRGRVRVPGDKSISHRAAIIGALASGETRVRGFLQADDCLRTVDCLRALGVRIEDSGRELTIQGSSGRLTAPPRVLDTGNSGTTMRLLSGVLAGQPFSAALDGDASLRRRPMDRVAEPLTKMGAAVSARDGKYPPLRITGGRLRGITYVLPVPSAQVKSAVLLAGLRAEGMTEVVEPIPTRDHTERMLAQFGVPVHRDGDRVRVSPVIPQGGTVEVPGDISSAAFLLTCAAAAEGSDLAVEDVGLNPTRTGVLELLQAMGAEITIEIAPPREAEIAPLRGAGDAPPGDSMRPADAAGEPVGTVRVRGRRLHGVVVDGAMIPRVIDELPVLCIAAAVAEGRTVIRDATELRVKESDRIGAMTRGLRALGAAVEERPDGLEISGGRLRGGVVDAGGDHRMAMAFTVAGLLADGPVSVRGAEAVAVSFPGFFETLQALRGV